MKIDRATSQLSGTRSTIYTATQDGEIVFSLLATSNRVCNLYLTRTTGGLPVEYTARLTPFNIWRLPGKIVLRTGESFMASVMEVSAFDWHVLPNWDTNPNWDYPGGTIPPSAIAQIDLSVIQI